MKTQTIILKNGAVIMVNRRRKYATVHFDLYRSNYELNKGGLEMLWKIYDRFSYVKTSCVASATCGTFKNILIEQCEALASSLKDLLNNTEYLELIHVELCRHLDPNDVLPQKWQDTKNCSHYKQCWKRFE